MHNSHVNFQFYYVKAVTLHLIGFLIASIVTARQTLNKQCEVGLDWYISCLVPRSAIAPFAPSLTFGSIHVFITTRYKFCNTTSLGISATMLSIPPAGSRGTICLAVIRASHSSTATSAASIASICTFVACLSVHSITWISG